MPARNMVLTPHQAQFVELRLAALKEAVQVGITDIDHRALTSFDSAEALGQHLAEITAEIIGR